MMILVWLLMAGVAWAGDGVVTSEELIALDSCGLVGNKQPDGICEVTLEIDKGWRVLYHGHDVACLPKMQAAMEAMEESRNVPYASFDGCNHCNEYGCTLVACPNGGDEVARLEWELKRTKEAVERKAKLTHLWAEAKQCWKP